MYCHIPRGFLSICICWQNLTPKIMQFSIGDNDDDHHNDTMDTGNDNKDLSYYHQYKEPEHSSDSKRSVRHHDPRVSHRLFCEMVMLSKDSHGEFHWKESARLVTPYLDIR